MGHAKPKTKAKVEEPVIVGFRRLDCKKCHAEVFIDFYTQECPNCGAPMTVNPRKKVELSAEEIKEEVSDERTDNPEV